MNEKSQITCSELEALAINRKVLVIDLRDPLEFACGHLPEAINVMPEQLKMFLDNASKELCIVLCNSTGVACPETVALFREFGFGDCYYLEGGYENWAAQSTRQYRMSEGLCTWLDQHGYDCNDLDKRSFNGETALMFAARQGQLEYVVDIIDRGADIEALNDDGNSAVWLACFANNIHILQELIRSGAYLDQQNANGATPLIYSASAGRLEMVNMLIEAGANVFLQTLDGFSAIDVASTLPILKRLRQQMNDTLGVAI